MTSHGRMRHSFEVFLPSAFLSLTLALVGCVHVPFAKDNPGNLRANLSSHVAFLADPSLKGRKPGTSGSRAARDYISARFKEAGLVPWGKEKSFEQSFEYGRNVVGVLPGSDPILGKEIVLVSAHYD